MSTSETKSRQTTPRKKPRYAANLSVNIFGKDLVHTTAAKTANVSEGGLFLCTEMSADTHEKLHLRIILSDKNAFFDVRARVVWICDGSGSHPQGLGVEFIELTEQHKAIINNILVDYVNVRSGKV